MIDVSDVRDWETDLRSRFPGAQRVLLASTKSPPAFVHLSIQRAARALAATSHRLPCQRERERIERQRDWLSPAR